MTMTKFLCNLTGTSKWRLLFKLWKSTRTLPHAFEWIEREYRSCSGSVSRSCSVNGRYLIWNDMHFILKKIYIQFSLSFPMQNVERSVSTRSNFNNDGSNREWTQRKSLWVEWLDIDVGTTYGSPSLRRSCEGFVWRCSSGALVDDCGCSGDRISPHTSRNCRFAHMDLSGSKVRAPVIAINYLPIYIFVHLVSFQTKIHG